jgi:hypothetical protein
MGGGNRSAAMPVQIVGSATVAKRHNIESSDYLDSRAYLAPRPSSCISVSRSICIARPVGKAALIQKKAPAHME